MTIGHAIRSDKGSAATEFALVVPLMLILLFGGMEAGHFVWTQHKLAEAVRDGARYGARLPIDEVCDGTAQVLSTEAIARIKRLTRTGQVVNPSANPKVPGWTDAQVVVNPNCDNDQFVNTGLYTEYAAAYDSGDDVRGPVIVVSATNVTYPWMFNALGSVMSGISNSGQGGLTLSASSNSPGIGL
ncbi:TadE/TadG family type IV pilus assembly protein [Tsuneonella amylolytica]|uniref:TadE/TadG family type IV pilus assembly protein n=1 Tax=Tsuneonella amylolytica TaxID=2338327 RepID=UPI000EAA841C|nr:TadE/TadG family type IV pilus assembly protein [Tsuneonella amylolytica]